MGVEFGFEEDVVEKKVGGDGADEKAEKVPEIAEVGSWQLADSRRQIEKDDAGEVGGVSHAGQKTEGLILLPDGENGPVEI